jgi:uncharacterized membrane protein
VRELVAFVYPDAFRAAEVMATLHRLRTEVDGDLGDTVCISRDSRGRVALQYAQCPTAETPQLRFWQALVRSFVSPTSPGTPETPETPGARGASGDPARGLPPVPPLDERFSAALRAGLRPGSSAVLVLVRDVTGDRLVPRVGVFGGTILRTPLPDEASSRHPDALRSEGSGPNR